MSHGKAIVPSYGIWFVGLPLISVTLAVVYLLWQQPQVLRLLDPASLSSTMERMGLWGPLLYIVIITLSVVISQIPGAPLAVAAGALWDPLLAGIYTIIGGFSGALLAYGLGRTMGASIIVALTGKTLSFPSGQRYLDWMIFATRLLPVFSFDLVSYGAGIAGLSLPTYASATFFGMVPSTLLLTYLGGSLQLSGPAMASLATIFLLLFVGIPVLLHHHNWLNIRALVSLN